MSEAYKPNLRISPELAAAFEIFGGPLPKMETPTQKLNRLTKVRFFDDPRAWISNFILDLNDIRDYECETDSANLRLRQASLSK